MNILQFIRNAFFGEQSVADSTQSQTQIQLTMKELITKIADTTTTIMNDLGKFATGNKAAGVRARKASLELEKLYKEFRKRSVHEMVEKD